MENADTHSTESKKRQIVIGRGSPLHSDTLVTPASKEIVVTNIRMKFWSMVWFMVKWAIASIPAMIILFIIGLLLFLTLLSPIVGIPSFMRARQSAIEQQQTLPLPPHSTYEERQ